MPRATINPPAALCPFCHGEKQPEGCVQPPPVRTGKPQLFWVNCPTCGAAGPTARDPYDAILLWNRAANPQRSNHP